MNNNYDIITKYICNNKYVYNNNEQDSKIYIFELELYDIDNSKSYIRKLVKLSKGVLISTKDNILYQPIKKYILTIIDINNLHNINTIQGDISDNVIKCNNIYIYFHKDQEFIKCIYNIF